MTWIAKAATSPCGRLRKSRPWPPPRAADAVGTRAASTSSAIALTLRAVGGLTTAEIANAFLVPEATMAQRISRAKETIRSSGVAFRMPTREERARRLNAVLHTLYLIYSEGYTSSADPTLHRTDLSSEAMRLARALHQVLPDDAEVAALLALMLLTDARRPARTDGNGELVPLDEQDRTLWNKEFIAEGVALVSAALPKGRVGPYQIQAAIAAIHDEAARFEETDWPQILAFYQVLERLSNNPIVSLNRIVATAMVEGPKAGLDALDVLAADARLKGHYRLDAVRAHLLEKVGDREAGSTVEAFTMAGASMGAGSTVEAFTMAGGSTGAGSTVEAFTMAADARGADSRA